MSTKLIITPVPIESPPIAIPSRLKNWNLFSIVYGEEEYIGNMLVPKKVDFTEIIRVYDLWQNKKNFREKERKKDSLYISVIGERIYPRSNNYFSKWRQFRLEYGGVHENCIYSGSIRVPPNASASDIREVLRIWQEEK